MGYPAGNLHFKLMALMLRTRDVFFPPAKVLRKVAIKQGSRVLDYGCGPGSYSVAAATLTGESGVVYALDILPIAVESVRKAALKKGLNNIKTIRSDCATGLENESIDVVLLYDAFSHLGEGDTVLRELHRVLKPDGILSFDDHHMKEDEILSKITDGGLFKLARKQKQCYTFSKQ